jgi:TRAP-type C4-dicarboxylate transport system permease small subunit
MYFANLKMTSAFKLIFLSSLMGFLILALVFGVMATFGYDTVRMNGRPVHGLLALPASFLIAFFIALLFSAFGTFGFFLLRLMFPQGTLGDRSEPQRVDPA